MHEARRVGGLQRGRGLRDDVEHPVGGQDALALEDGGERLAGHELHHEVGAALLLAVVVDVGDALMVHESGVAGLRAEALEEAGVAQILVLEDLDGDGAPDDEIRGFPDLAHAADGDTVLELVATAEGDASDRPHRFSTASNTCFAMGAATRFPNPV
ncbi:hypothetical protein GCM10025866_13040 [Naasia aerilata]|uniref:Uncharacterized protein n=1 Tax=Naasia aerilata TaxID=1162966 RepID=A0ABM8GAZ8_9MICO|nr:hypothetical protein GCM10025866_13040 [Naasia aerilata]